MKIKKYDSTNGWVQEYPEVNVGAIVVSNPNDASSSTFLRGDGTWATPTAADGNNYLTGVSGSGDGTVTFTRSGLSNLTWDASHTHSEYLLTTGKAADSNLLDGLDSGSFVRSDTTDYYTRLLQSSTGTPTNNLGGPSITEMALFQEQFNNKTAFYTIANLKFYTSSDGTNWTEYTSFSDTNKRKFLGGDNNSGIIIPNLTDYFRIELTNNGNYVYLNALYMYWSSNSHNTTVKIRKQRGDGVWSQHTNSSTTVSSWPGHLYLPFSTIPFHPSTTSTGHYRTIHIDFEPNWSGHATYGSYNINLYRMQIWGGYPAGRQTIYSVNENQVTYFPSDIYSNNNKVLTTADEGSGNGIDADTLDGQHGSYYAPLASPALTGTPTAPTAAANTNTTQIATTAYVQQEITDLIGGAPGALDTLNELAAAINDDASYASTITTALAGKVAKSGDTMTGTLTISAAKTTDDPLLKLVSTATGDADAIIELEANDTGEAGIIFKNPDNTNSSGWFLGSGDALSEDFYLYDRQNSTPRLVVGHDGNVGIGTTNPLQKLQVNGDITVDRNATGSGATITLANGSEVAGNYSSLMFGNVNAHNNYRKGGIAYRTDGQGYGRGDIYFLQRTDANSGNADLTHHAMVIKNDGKVGIGTDSPTEKLTVVGDSNTSENSPVTFIKHNFTGTHGFGLSISRDNSDIAALALGSNSSNHGIVVANNTDLVLSTISSGVINSGMTVKTSGNVGIGTTSPETKLKVLDTVNYTSPTLGTNSGSFSVIKTDSAADQVGDYGLLMGISGSGWSWLQAQRVDGTATAYALNLQPSGGNVGIGTSTPARKLDVAGDMAITSTFPRIFLVDTDTNSDFSIINSNGQFSVYDDTNGAYRLAIESNGNVGIGTTTPAYKLDVEGDFRVKATYDFVIRQLEISSSSYDRRVITLVPKHTSNAGATRAVYGEFTLGKKGGNIFDPFKLGVQSVYNNTRGFIQENGTNKVGHKFVEFDYNSVRWIGVELAYEANPYNYCMFYGTAETDTASGDQLKVLSYYDENGGGVLNSEIYNSLADFTVSNSTDTIYYNGHEVWHDGNDGIGSGLHADLLDGQHGSYYAPLASPTFTGIPTAPTTATSDNSTKIATTAYVKSNISDLIGGAPDALNTLNELAAALADDENYAATITTALGTKVAKSGGNTISGNQNFYGNDTSGVYSSAPIEIREVNLVTTNQSSSAYAPGLAFHWGGRVQTQIKLHSDGNLNLSGNQTGRILTTADEGSGNGLDADTLDTYHASSFYLASNPNGYTSNAGTVTNVTGGTGVDVTNGTTTPSITLDLSEFTSMTDDVNGLADELILLDGGAERRKTISSIKLSQFNNDAGWSSRRPVTAGGNSLASSESLDFIAGTGITISESGGDVTISASSSGEPEWEYVTKVSGANPLTYSGMDALSNYEYKFVVEVVTTAEDNSNPYIRINNDSTTGETSYQYTRVQQTTLTGETETHNGNANSNLIYTGLALSSYSNGGTSVSTVHNAEFIYTISPYSSSPGIYTGIVDGWGSTHYSSQSGTAYDGMVQSRFTGRKRSIYQTEANRIDYYHDITAGTTDYSEMRVYRRPKK